MAALDRVRIVVLGDSGVGKTSLVRLISGASGAPGASTIGATVEVKLHEYKEGTPAQKTFWIELVDVGGFHSHRNMRHVYYNNSHGIVLVHDLSNKKSQVNLDKWLREFLEREAKGNDITGGDFDVGGGNGIDHQQQPVMDVNVPLLVIGTKLDLASDLEDKESKEADLPVHDSTSASAAKRRSAVADEYLAEEIHVNCNDDKSLVAGSSALNKLARFFDKVIEKQFYRSGNHQHKSAYYHSASAQQSLAERRRLNVQ